MTEFVPHAALPGGGERHHIAGVVGARCLRWILRGASRVWLLSLLVCLGKPGAAELVLPSGAVDPTFDPGKGPDATVSTLLVLPDDRILLGGYFSAYDGRPVGPLIRLTASGALDESFGPVRLNGGVIALAQQSDGKIIAGGEFTSWSGTRALRLIRLQANGELDTTFSSAASVEGSSSPAVMCLAVQPDDRILVGGFFTQVNGVPQAYVAQLDRDGNLDLTWRPQIPVGEHSGVLSLRLLQDGKVLVGGQFEEVDQIKQRTLVRLNHNGSVDTTFRPAFSKPSAVFDIWPFSDGGCLVGGYFVEVDGQSRRGIVKLTRLGAVDEAFSPGWAMDHQVNALAVQRDGKILAGGYFTDFNLTPVSRVVRLLPTGLIDPGFQVVPGVSGGENPGVLCVGIQRAGGILVGGEFTALHDLPRSRLARMVGDLGSAQPRPFKLTGLGMLPDGFKMDLTGEDGREYTIDRSLDAQTWNEWRTVTTDSRSVVITDSEALNGVRMFYRAWTP